MLSPVARPETMTTSGVVRGRWHGSTAVFLGVPYAEPPVGGLRFAAPVPHRSWNEVHDAGSFGSTPQRMKFGSDPTVPESSVAGDSTLNINVFTPSLDGVAPVLVYIHGGSFVSGSPASPWYDGRTFARDGIVTVTLSYRLGFDGFGWIEDAPANRGVLDWLLALEWVRDNIAFFGGDPSRVTIAGQSAGGGAVLTLLGIPEAQPLFSQVISMSGLCADIPQERAERLGHRVAKLGKVSPTRDGLAQLSEAQILKLQVAATRLAGTTPLLTARSAIYDTLKFGPVVDGTLVRRTVIEAVRAGIGLDKPMLIGATDNEVSATIKSFNYLLRRMPRRLVMAAVGVSRADEEQYLAANPGLATQGCAAVLAQYVTDVIFRAPVLDRAEIRGRLGAASMVRTWLYRFSLQYSVNRDAPHCADVPFFFDKLRTEKVRSLAGVHPPQALATEMHRDVGLFVRSGSPGWGQYEGHSKPVKVYDVPTTMQSDGYGTTRSLIGIKIGRGTPGLKG